MSKKLTKEEVKRSDIFIRITDHTIAWIEKHGKSIAMTILVFAMAGAAYVGYEAKLKSDEKKAQATLYSLRTQGEKLEVSFKSEKKTDEEGGVGASQEATPTLDFNQHFAPLIKEYTQFFADYRKTNSEKVGYLQLADLYAQNERWEEATKLLEKGLKLTDKRDFYYGLLAIKLSQVQMSSKAFDHAVKTLETISGQPEQKHLHAESLLRIGLCYSLQSNGEKAKQYFERVERDFANSDAAKSAKNYLRLMALEG